MKETEKAAFIREPKPWEAFEAGRMDCSRVDMESEGLGDDQLEAVCAMCGHSSAAYYNVRDTGPLDKKRRGLPIVVTVVNCICGLYAIEPKPTASDPEGEQPRIPDQGS